MTTREDIVNALRDAIDDIMLKAEQRENILTGDITPLQVWEIGDGVEHIATVLAAVLEQNRTNKN